MFLIRVSDVSGRGSPWSQSHASQVLHLILRRRSPLPRTAPHAMADLGADLLESLSEAAAAIPANKNRKEGDAFCLNITPDVGAFVFGFSAEGSGVGYLVG